VVSGQVLDVTSFLGEHPGGELAILTFAGKDATEEFNMIHPPDVIGKYAPNAVIGAVGGGGGEKKEKKGKKGKKGAAAAVPARQDLGTAMGNFHAWGESVEDKANWRFDRYDNPGVFLINVKAYLFGAWYLIMALLWEVCATIFSNQNFKISNDRKGLTRSAILLILFIVIHAVGNLHVFMGPDDFNGYGYFYVRLYWTGFGLPANIVEEYILLSIILHVIVGLKRTWDMKLTSGIWGAGFLDLAISGVMLLTFMTIHLFQFRFGDTAQFGPYYINPPPFMINLNGILQWHDFNLFWCDPATEGAKNGYDWLIDWCPADQTVGVRDIYALEFQLFNNPFWVAFYCFSVVVFMFHACVGWKKVTPALGVPKLHIPNVEKIGYAIFIVLGSVYISFPLFVTLTASDAGKETNIQYPSNRVGA
jgi:hypothetical protein